MLLELGFQQLENIPTRGENILDVMLCDDALSVFNSTVKHPSSFDSTITNSSDHNSVVFNILKE